MQTEDWIRMACTTFQEAERNSELSVEAKVAIIDLFNTDITSARSYALIQDDDIRKAWARMHLGNLLTPNNAHADALDSGTL